MEAITRDHSVKVRCAIMCGPHLTVSLSAADAASVKRWARILIPTYAVLLSALFGLVIIGAP